MKLVMMVLTVILIILQYRIWFSHDNGISSILHLNLAIKIQQQNNALLEDRNKILIAEVLYLKYGLNALEESARNKLGLIKREEIFLQLIEHNDK